MKRLLQRATTIVTAAAAAVVALGVAVPAVAHAATLGTVSLLPGSGDVAGGIRVGTDTACPDGTASTAVTLYGGPNSWPDYFDNGANLIGANTLALDYRAPVTAGSSILQAAQASGLVLAEGTYDLRLYCFGDIDATTTLGTFDSQVALTADSSGSGYRYAPAGLPVPTSTTTLSAPSTGIAGTALGVSATVTATGLAAGITTSGTVRFTEGTTVLGTATVGGLTDAPAGQAVSGSVTFAAAGQHSVTAVFVPDDPTVVATSSSAPATVTITDAGPGEPAATTTTLTVSSGNGDQRGSRP